MLRINDISSSFSACIQSIGANVGKLGSNAVSFFQSQSPAATGLALALNGALVVLIKKTITLVESRFKLEYSDQVKHGAFGLSAATVTYALNAGLSKAGYQMQLVTKLALSAFSGLFIYRALSKEAALKAQELISSSSRSSTPKAKVDDEGEVKQSPSSKSSSESATEGKGLGTKIENLNPTDPAADSKKLEATKSSWWPSFF